MQTTVLAHGGQITGDEMMLIGGGLFFVMAFPIGALLIAMRRTRRRADAAPVEEGGR